MTGPYHTPEQLAAQEALKYKFITDLQSQGISVVDGVRAWNDALKIVNDAQAAIAATMDKYPDMRTKQVFVGAAVGMLQRFSIEYETAVMEAVLSGLFK